MALTPTEPPVEPPAPASTRLKPVLGVSAVILLTVSCITPASSLFIIVPQLLVTQGSGVVIALGTADYLSSIAHLDRATTGAVVMLLATGTAILDVRANAFVTSCFLALEVVAAGVVAYLGFAHAERPVSTLVRPDALTEGKLSPFTLGVVVSGFLVAMLIVNGFGTASYLAEEMIEPRRDVARAVFGSIFIGAVVIIVPTAAVVLGARSLEDLGTRTFPGFVESWAGPGVAAAVSAAVALAILNAVIVMVLQNGRVMYASGRDHAWPAPVNAALTRLHARFGTPVVATLAVALPGAAFAYFLDIAALVGITSVIIAVVYLLLAVGALAARRKPHAGWKMPWWPVAPVVVIIAIAYALTQSGPADLAITAGIVVAALGYEVLYLRPRRETRFLVDAREDR